MNEDPLYPFVYYPKMVATLDVPVLGSQQEREAQQTDHGTTQITVNPFKASITRNNHNAADECSITLDWKDAGVDPRLLGNAIVQLYMGTDDGTDSWKPDGTQRRFVGIATDIEREASESGMTVTIKALDYTTLFIESKPYPPEGIPTYNMDLAQAWDLICDHAGGKDVYGKWFTSCQHLANKIVPLGIPNWPPKLSGAVSGRFKAIPVAVKPNTDAWAIWQHCVGMMGLISWIDQEVVYVSTATNYYTSTNTPIMVWGKNIKAFRERRNCAFSGKKICMMSFDPLTGKTIQALWPPPAERKAKKKSKSVQNNAMPPGKTVGSGVKNNPKHTQDHSKTKVDGGLPDEYDVFENNGVTDPNALMEIAKRVYEERSRQEMTGSLTTSEMWTEQRNSGFMDLLTLGAGQDIEVRIENDDFMRINLLSTPEDKEEWLLSHDYSPGLAKVLSKDASGLAGKSPVFHTEHVTVSLETDQNGGGNFEVEIGFLNKIDI